MNIVIIGTFDTKGEELSFAREVIEDQGLDVHFMDTGIMSNP